MGLSPFAGGRCYGLEVAENRKGATRDAFVPQEKREALADAVDEMALHFVLGLIMTQAVTDGPINALLEGQERWVRDTIRANVLSEAVASARMSLVMLTDELRAVALCLRSPEQNGAAIGMLVRGIVENAGRAHWIMHAPDQETMLKNWMRLRLMNQAFLISQEASDENQDMHRRLAAAADSLGIAGKERGLKYGTMAIGFLDTINGTKGSAEYSFLSAIAHGDAIAHALMTTDLGEKTHDGLRTTLVTLRPELLDHLLFLLAGATLTAALRFFQAHGVDRDLFGPILLAAERLRL